MLIGLLEDDLAIQEMLRLLLEGEGYDVVPYPSVEACLADLHIADARLSQVNPALLMIDLHLAQSVSGLSVIEQIRANSRLATLPIILMTASASVDQQDLQRLGVILLLKPFDIDEIIHLVDTLVRAS